MIETINQQLQLLKLSGIKQALKQQLEQPNLYQEQSFIERVSLLLTHEIDTRNQRKIERLVRSKIPRTGSVKSTHLLAEA